MNAHGQYAIETFGQILFVDATGPFNEFAVREKRTDLRSAIASLEQAPWAMFVIFRDTSLFTPEAEKETVKAILQISGKGFIATAVLFVDVAASLILKSKMKRVFNAAGVEHAFFDMAADAHDWLGARGFPVFNSP